MAPGAFSVGVTAPEPPLFGSISCMQPACKHTAYYVHAAGDFRCGRHTKVRRTMRKMSAAQKDAKERSEANQHDIEVRTAANNNKRDGLRGRVLMQRMRMRHRVMHAKGFCSVFPNNKHGQRKDGVGLCTLSPMRCGPVRHGQPGLPDAANVENFHQQSKRFASESDAEFAAARLAGYVDVVPHRHKVKGVKPLHSVWLGPDGTVFKLGVVEARQLYCNFYERLVLQLPEWGRLLALVDGGTNVQIVGYDAVPFATNAEDSYTSVNTSFGHERVLFTMLTQPDAATWPWRKHKTLAF